VKILVVEDQEHIARLERMVLITDGFDVETAAGGREALEKLRGTRYDGLVLDMLMPEIDGCEVLHQLKAIRLNRQTPVIMVTASLEPGMRQRAFEAGAAAFLNKPFTAEAFRSVIRSAINLPQQPSASPNASLAPALASPGAAEPRLATAATAPAPGAAPAPVLPGPPPPASAGPVPAAPTPTWRRPRPAVGKITVRTDTGATYSCPPDPQGGWRCGRCELGLITSEHDVPVIGSRCTVCQAEVVQTPDGERRRWWPF
jgi:CheY-like chemotaxis protein